MSDTLNRRHFIGACSASFAALLAPASRAWARSALPHPSPRPGITAAKVLTRAELEDRPKLVALFDSVRKIPEVLDGIRCNCDCTSPPEMYSLLSCYEEAGMARDCIVCQGQGSLVVRLHTEGKTLDQIRAAVDAKFG